MNASTFFRLAALLPPLLAACAPQQHSGMVMDRSTGLQHGSVIEKNIVIDASQFRNKKVKLRIRNTSGDPVFDLHAFSSSIMNAYQAKGYEPTDADNFGMLVDVNVLYSGQTSRDLASQFGFLGGAGGGVAGAALASDQLIGVGAGILAGATLGSIMGSYVTDDTYIVVAEVTLGLVDPERGGRETTIVFGSGQKRSEEEEPAFRRFRESTSTGISVYAGGRNTPQDRIADGVRQRFARIISDVI